MPWTISPRKRKRRKSAALSTQMGMLIADIFTTLPGHHKRPLARTFIFAQLPCLPVILRQGFRTCMCTSGKILLSFRLRQRFLVVFYFCCTLTKLLCMFAVHLYCDLLKEAKHFCPFLIYCHIRKILLKAPKNVFLSFCECMPQSCCV